ncbi:MAG: fibronectin type III domain-containing protein [Actinomycetota bacterium]
MDIGNRTPKVVIARALAIALLSVVAGIARADVSAPGPATSLVATRGPSAGQVSLTWQSPLSVLTPAPTGYRVYRGTTTPTTTVVRDDDGAMDLSYTLEASDDRATKRLNVPSLNFASKAKLWVWAKASNCNYRGASTSLLVNGSSLATFDRCAIWSASQFEYKSFDIPLARLNTGSSNSFEIRNGSGYSFGYKTIFGLDQTNDFGRTDARQDNVDLVGELMWYLAVDATSLNGDAVGVATTTATSHVDSGLGRGAKHYYFVTSLNESAESGPSNQAIATTFDAAGPIRSLSASAGPSLGQIGLSWLAPADNGEPAATSYRVYRDSAEIAQVTTTSFGDTGLLDASTYDYAVSAVNVTGEGVLTSVSGRTLDVLPIPEAPTNLTESPDHCDAAVDLSWLAPPTNASISGYRVYRDAAILVQSVNATSWRDTAATRGAKYAYRVSSLNPAGESPLSNEVSMPFPDWGCYRFGTSDEGFVKRNPQPVSEVAHDSAAGWVDVVSQRSDARSESFTRGLGASLTPIADFTLTSKWSVTSNGANQATVPIFLSSAGVNDVISQPNSAYVYYSGGDPYGRIKSGYFLRYRDASGILRINTAFVTVPGSYVTYPLSNHVLSIDYRAATRTLSMRVKSGVSTFASASHVLASTEAFTFDEVGISTQGSLALPDDILVGSVDDVEIWHRNSAPTPPVSLAALPQSGSVSLSWTPPRYDGGSSVTGYRVYRRSLVTGVEVFVGATTATTYTDAAPVGFYAYRASATNANGEGHRSDPVNVAAV